MSYLKPYVTKHVKNKQETYCETGKEPTQSTKNESFDETYDIQKLPSLRMNTITSKKDCDRTIDGHTERKQQKPSPEKKRIIRE